MKKFALLIVLAFELAVCGCGNNTPNNTVSTSASGSWEALMTGGTGAASQLNFVTTFDVLNSGPLDIKGFSFFNNGACFGNSVSNQNESGSTTLSTSSTNTVTGPFTFTVQSTNNGNVLTLNGNLTGTSNGTTGTIGTLSGGVVVGTWTLQGGGGDPSCANQGGSFLMCQGKSTCTAP